MPNGVVEKINEKTGKTNKGIIGTLRKEGLLLRFTALGKAETNVTINV